MPKWTQAYHRFFLIICLAGFSLTAMAQNFEFYTLAGPVVSQIDGDRVGGYNKLGAVAGIGVAYPFQEVWYAMMELSYIGKGKGSFNESSLATYKTSLHYIQLPLLISRQVHPQFVVETGLSTGYLLAYEFYEDGSPTNSDPYRPTRFDMDGLLGLSYLLNAHWKLNLRFSYSLFHMNKISGDYYRSNIWKHPLGKYNRNMALAFQYWF